VSGRCIPHSSAERVHNKIDATLVFQFLLLRSLLLTIGPPKSDRRLRDFVPP